MTPKDQALRILLDAAPARDGRDVETVPLGRALGRVLGRDLASDIDMPPFHRSAMDGYAVRAADLASLPAELRILETIKAGEVGTKRVEAGTCSKIMTGAPVPDGADAVVQVEWTKALDGERVRIERGVATGANISPRGEDMTKGETVLRAGLVLRSVEIGVIAALGFDQVPVLTRPRLAVVATGDELIAPGTGVPGPGQIRETNGHMLCALAAELGMGIEAEYLGIARDTPESVRDFLERGFAADVLILSGGVSMGDFDYVHHELKARGLEVLLEKVAIKPGKPLLFGRMRHEGRTSFVFGLPGNPMSSYATFQLFVRPFLRALMGRSGPHVLDVTARLLAPIDAKAMPRAQHIPARLAIENSEIVARPVPWHGSGDLRGMVDANGFVIVETNCPPVTPGERIAAVALEPDAFRLPSTRSRFGAAD